MNKKYTIVDVAELAGVGKATVSRAFSSPSLVSAATYKKIMEAAQKLNYSPNPIARALNNANTNNITIVVPNIESIIMGGIIRGCMHYLSQENYSLIVLDSSENFTEEKDYTNLLSSTLTDGVIFCYGSAKQTMSKVRNKLPLVFIELEPDDQEIDYIIIDFQDGIKQIIGHLLENGHQKIAFILGKKDDFSLKRLEYIERAAQELDLKIPEEYLIFNNWTIQDGYDSLKKLLLGEQVPSAVVYISDFMALGGISAAHDLGLKIPEDLVIVGTDDSLTSGFSSPALTTLGYSPYELGVKAAELVLKRLRNPSSPRNKEVLPVDLKIRASSRKES